MQCNAVSETGRDWHTKDPEERSRHLADARSIAVLERARLMRCRAAEAGKKLKDHEKRRLCSSQMWFLCCEIVLWIC